MVETRTVTVKVTPHTLKLVRKIAARTGEKQYAVFERLAKNESEFNEHWEPDPRVPPGSGWMDEAHPRKAKPPRKNGAKK